MSRFIIGDDLGSLKVLRYSDNTGPSGSKVHVKSVYQTTTSLQGETRVGVQALTTLNSEEGVLAAAAFSDGKLHLSRLGDDDSLEPICSWTEPRLKTNRFVGVALTNQAVFSCTSAGALRKENYVESSETPSQNTRALPTRLCDWKLSPTADTFTYGGEEVPLSVWNTERAFQETTSSTKLDDSSNSKKRKRADVLIPGEVWRAKNLPNDSLNVRQPVRITALDFIRSSRSSSDLVAGTQAGDVHHYDTRAARRPVHVWKTIGKDGVRSLTTGWNPNELFVSDNATNLYSVDLRIGKVLYGYHGIAASVSCMATSNDVMVSGALDQYARVHSVSPPSPNFKERLDNKGEVVEKLFLQCTPTCVAWDTRPSSETTSDDGNGEAADDSDHDIWDELETASDDDGESEPKAKRRLQLHKKKSI